MFTGIIEHAGRVRSLVRGETGARLVLGGVPFAAELALGESVAVNGCCLTVTAVENGDASFDLLAETLRVTNLGALETGGVVNLERALRAGDRFSGHYVQGHVDGKSEILDFSPAGSDFRLEIALAAEFRSLVVSRGSICVDGISLTVAELKEASFVCWIIPHTRAVTSLQAARAGARVNLEFDVLAKYVQRAMDVRWSSGLPGGPGEG